MVKFPLTSLKSEEQFQAAQAVLDELLAKGKLNAGEEMYLDALSDLLASYEDAHYPIAPASDADMLRHLMEAKGVTQADLHRDTGLAKSSISEVLAGQKALQPPDDPHSWPTTSRSMSAFWRRTSERPQRSDSSVVQPVSGFGQLPFALPDVSGRCVQRLMAEDLGQADQIAGIVLQILVAHRVAKQVRVQLEAADRTVLVAQGPEATVGQWSSFADEHPI